MICKNFSAPQWIDLQVNGGGGVLFNASPNLDGLTQILAAHRRRGTARLLATIVTDAAEVRESATRAVVAGLEAGAAGLLGLHFEGPFINPAKSGVHDPRFITTPTPALVTEMTGQIRRIRQAGGYALVTLAPEITPADALAELVGAGAVIAAGHSAASYETAMAGFAAGITGVTHLFNAMSGLDHRAPGLAAAALERDDIWCGVIADGFHVHDALLRLALRLKPAGKLVLVSDAMPTVGGPDSFTLNDRLMRRDGGRLIDETGRLAGADIALADAVVYLTTRLGVTPETAAAMASTAPLAALGL